MDPTYIPESIDDDSSDDDDTVVVPPKRPKLLNTEGSAVFSAEPKVPNTDGCSEIWGCTLFTLPNNEECTPEPFSKCYSIFE